MKRRSSWSGGWSGGGGGEEAEDVNFSFTSSGAAPAVGYGALTRPTILSKEAYIWSEEDDGSESWRMSQYGFKLQETEAAENTIEWRTGDTMRVSMREGYADQVTQFWFETVGRAATDDYTVAEFAVKNSDSINSAYSRVTWAGYAVHDSAPYFFVQLRRGTASAANAWYATHDGTLKQAWFGATPVAKAGATSDLKDALVNYGLLTDGGATPLNLDGGALTVGAISGSTVTASTAFIGPIWRPESDSTSALKIQSAAGAADIVTFDTTNLTVGIGEAPLTSAVLLASKSVSADTHSVAVYIKSRRYDHTFPIGARNVTGLDIYTYTDSVTTNTKATTQTGFIVSNIVAAASGLTSTVSSVVGAKINTPSGSGAGTKVITTSRGLWIANQGNSAVTTSYGIYLDVQGGATTTYAFYSLGGQSFFRAGASTEIPLILQAAGSHTANILELRNSSAAILAQLDANGALVLNEQGADADSRFEGDTATHLFVLDAGLDAIQIGTTSAGVIADFRSAAIVFNEDGADRDVRFEGDTDANNFFSDASTDRIGIGTNSPSYKLHVAGDMNLSSTYVYRINGTQVLAAQGAAVADASGGATIDAEARTAINTLLARMRTHGLIAT